ncbi:hypothetical protein V6N12_002006 [Hibiscus sabdariffa]|uniref:Protein kinase domain-containing protein n=1 Tax=Hibiscus sabdariffa TaxID=183260 RepID=A0ABR2B5W3_9ROSI
MVGVKYKVTDIIPYRRILKLTRIDTLEDGLCQFHSPLRDSVVDFDLFDLAPPPPPAINYINITLAFDCLQPTIPSPQIISQYPCSSTIYNNISITINATVLHGCVANVTFPVVETNLLHSHNDSFSLASILSTIMEEGFQVKWKENTEACRKCNASGGACGFDSFGQPLCYCPQYQSHDECGHRDHVRSKGKLKENAVIISISVIVTGGIALLAFWFYVRKINVREAGVHENRDTIFHVMDFATIAFATNNFSSNNVLPWSSRMKIIDGIVKGILYLHHESRLKIVHRNLKPANILLDENMNPKITDFGLSRLLGEDESRAIATRMAGTWYRSEADKPNPPLCRAATLDFFS